MRQASGFRLGLIRKSGFESRITFGLIFGIGGGLRSLSVVLVVVDDDGDDDDDDDVVYVGKEGVFCSR